jgi:hemerythrin
MPLIQWKENFSVHFEKLDEHHKRFVGIINRLYDSVMTAETLDAVPPIIDELIQYSSYHFSAEEQFMRDTAYQGLDEHMAKHRMYLDKISELQRVKLDDQRELARELIIFLGDWLLHHILDEDKQYAN